MILWLFLTIIAVIVLNSYFGELSWSSKGWIISPPGAFALAGLVQFISGVPFNKLSSQWDSLKSWQRGLISTLILLLAIVVMLGVIALYLINTIE